MVQAMGWRSYLEPVELPVSQWLQRRGEDEANAASGGMGFVYVFLPSLLWWEKQVCAAQHM